MNRLKRVEQIVRKVLEEYPETRDDDFVLLTHVYYMFNPEIIGSSFNLVMLGHKEYGLPPFESVTRCRRKLQAKCKELMSSRQIEEARKREEEVYKEYANNCGIDLLNLMV